MNFFLMIFIRSRDPQIDNHYSQISGTKKSSLIKISHRGCVYSFMFTLSNVKWKLFFGPMQQTSVVSSKLVTYEEPYHVLITDNVMGFRPKYKKMFVLIIIKHETVNNAVNVRENPVSNEKISLTNRNSSQIKMRNKIIKLNQCQWKKAIKVSYSSQLRTDSLDAIVANSKARHPSQK